MAFLSAPIHGTLQKSMLEGTAPRITSSENVIKCAVTSCTNDSNTEIGGRKLLLHTPPSSPRLRRFWIEAVPALADQKSKVCEVHFLSQSSKIGMYPSLKLETRKRKQEACEDGSPTVVTIRKQLPLKAAMTGSLVGTVVSDSKPGTALPRKVIRVIHKSNIIKPANEFRPIQTATATVTVARPINLMDIIGDKSNVVSNSTPNNKTIDLSNHRALELYPSVPSTSYAAPIPTTSNPENDQEECSGDHEGAGQDASCPKCTSQLPAIRKSLARLETRLDTMLTMARTLLTRAQAAPNIAQRTVYTITPKPRVLTHSSDSIPTVNNVKIVKKLGDLPGIRKTTWPVKKLM